MEIEYNGLQFSGWIIGVFIAFVLLIIQFRRRHSFPYIFCFLIFSIYILKAVDLTFFPLGINGAFVDSMKTIPFTSFINLIPFYLGQHHIVSDRDLVMFGENILLTTPFGFGISFVSCLRPKDFLWLPFAIGFGIETAQLLISLLLQYPYRVIDINDALLNAAGVLVGYALFRIFARLFFQKSPRLKNIHGGWSAYIHEIVTRA